MTKAQRLSFYKELLNVVCEDECTDFGFCYYITIHMRHWYWGNRVNRIYAFDVHDFEKNLPELYAIRPTSKKVGGYWFPCTHGGWQKRIDRLVSIINKMEKQ